MQSSVGILGKEEAVCWEQLCAKQKRKEERQHFGSRWLGELPFVPGCTTQLCHLLENVALPAFVLAVSDLRWTFAS